MEDLTLEEAEFIRDLRLAGCTWRALSEEFCETLYPEALDWPNCKGNQLHGMDLCKYAAEHFGEDYQVEPWN